MGHFNPRKPYGLKDMDKAVDLLIKIKDENGVVVVNGDFDADGMDGSAIAAYGLKALGFKVELLSNNRRFGNGYNAAMHQIVMGMKPDLLFTVDHGSGKPDISRYIELRTAGIHTLISDHHTYGPETSEVVDVFINSRFSDDTKEMNGAYLAFEIIKALDQRMGGELLRRGTIDHMLPFVALTLKSDVMCLKPDYTRDTFRMGMHIARSRPSVLIREFNSIFSEESISYEFAPVINSFGRMGVSKGAVDMIMMDLQLSDTIKEGDKEKMVKEYLELVTMMDKAKDLNKKRKELTETLVASLPDIGSEDGFGKVVTVEGHEGLIGIVSSKLTDRYDEPAITISIDGDAAVMSCRAPYEFDILETLHEVQRKIGIFTQSDGSVTYGGHFSACGGKIGYPTNPIGSNTLRERVELFTKAWKDVMRDKVVDKTIKDILPYPNKSDTELFIDVLNSINGKEKKQKYRVTGDVKLNVRGLHMEVVINGMRCFMFNGAKHATERPTAVIVELGINSWSGDLNRTVIQLEK